MVCLFNDRVKIITGSERISIAGITTNQRIIALAPIQCIGHIDKEAADLDDIIAAIAAFNLQLTFNIACADHGAIGKTEYLNRIVNAAKLVTNAQTAIGSSIDRDQQIIARFSENNITIILEANICTKFNRVVHRHIYTRAIAPMCAYATINNDIMTIANIKDIGIAAIATYQFIITAATINDFTEI